MDSPNALLKDLAREREERSNSSLKRQRQATDTCDGGTSGSQPASSSSLATGEGEARVIVDLCDSDDKKAFGSSNRTLPSMARKHPKK